MGTIPHKIKLMSSQDTDAAVAPPPPDYTRYEELTDQMIAEGTQSDDWPVGPCEKPKTTEEAREILHRCPALVKAMYALYSADCVKDPIPYASQEVHKIYGPCRVLQKAPSKSNGYVQLSWKGVNKFVTHAKLAALMGDLDKEDKFQTASVNGRKEKQGSHRCGNALCFSKRHVILESAEANNNRKACGGMVQMEGQWVWMCHCDRVCLKVTLANSQAAMTEATATPSINSNK